MEREVDSYLRRKYETQIRDVEVVHKEDLDLVSVAAMHASMIACSHCTVHSTCDMQEVQRFQGT